MTLNKKKLALITFPLSLVYGLAIGLRNRLFDCNILKSTWFDIPVISVGNITVGGTGKTPHIEYLIRLLHKDYRIATLSRGYKRKTRDFILATKNSSVDEIGDEPRQLKQKFPDIIVAVDRKRVNGIKNKIVILVDDGLAMGSTMRVSIMLCRKKQAQKVVVAVPVAGIKVANSMKELSDELELSPSAVSYHLNKLIEIDIIQRFYDNNKVKYTLWDEKATDKLLIQYKESLLDEMVVYFYDYYFMWKKYKWIKQFITWLRTTDPEEHLAYFYDIFPHPYFG